MLKCELDDGHAVVAASGDVISLSAQCLYLLDAVFSAPEKQDARQAEAFRAAVVAGVTREGSPVFRHCLGGNGVTVVMPASPRE